MALDLLGMTDTTLTYFDAERMGRKQPGLFNPRIHGRENPGMEYDTYDRYKIKVRDCYLYRENNI